MTSQQQLSFLILFFIFVGLVPARAQTTDTIRSGRPGVGIGSSVVGRDYFQIESGVEHDRTYDSSKARADIFGNVLRYGFNEETEFVGLLSARDDYTADGSNAQKGFSEFQAGLRYSLIRKPSGLRPSFLVQTLFQLNAISPAYRSKDIGNSVVFAASDNLSKILSLNSNLGTEFDGDSTHPAYTFAEGITYSWTREWSTFLETYGDFQALKGSPHFDFGGAYLATHDFQYDFSAGYGKGLLAPEILLSLGISWRIQTATPQVHKQN